MKKNVFGFVISDDEKSEPLEFALCIIQEDGSVVCSSVREQCEKLPMVDCSAYDPTSLRDAGIKQNVVQPNSDMRLDTDTLNELNQYVHDNYDSIKN